MRELGDILARTWHQPPKQRERHILPKTLPRVTGPNKAALKLLILVGQQCAEVLIAGNLALCGSWKHRGMVLFRSAEHSMRSWRHDAQVMRALDAI